MIRQYYVAMIINGSNQMVVKTSEKDDIVDGDFRKGQISWRLPKVGKWPSKGLAGSYRGNTCCRTRLHCRRVGRQPPRIGRRPHIRISRQLSKQLMLQNATPYCRGGLPQQSNHVVGTPERWQTAIITPRSIN